LFVGVIAGDNRQRRLRRTQIDGLVRNVSFFVFIIVLFLIG
jgi:hypothetical protein